MQMVMNMKEIGKKIKKMEKENINLIMVINIMEIGKKMK